MLRCGKDALYVGAVQAIDKYWALVHLEANRACLFLGRHDQIQNIIDQVQGIYTCKHEGDKAGCIQRRADDPLVGDGERERDRGSR